MRRRIGIRGVLRCALPLCGVFPPMTAPIPTRPLGRLSAATSGTGSAASLPIVRAVLAEARSTFTADRNARNVVRSTWPTDRQTLALVERSASTVATTTGSGWADTFAHTVVTDLLTGLGPASAGSELLRRGTVLSFDGAAKLTVPGITAAAANASFVGQGAPIPVRHLWVSAGASLEPHKFATIVTLSREMIESSNAEALVRMALTDSLAAALDAALFSNPAGDTTRPPGLLYGVTPLTATTGGGVAAQWKDVAALVAAVSPTSGLNIAFVTDPGTVVKLMLAVGAKFSVPLFASNAITAGTVIAIGLDALVSAVAPQPRIQATR